MYRIGIDLGGTKMAAALVDDNYRIILKETTPTHPERPADRIADDMAGLCVRLCGKQGITLGDIREIGIASPGIIDNKNGMILHTCNLPFDHYPICRYLSDKLGFENIRVENDANAAAWGEAIAGAARGSQNSIIVTLGTGVGGGFVIDNKIYSGFNFAGGELGHMVIQVGGRLCGCGRRGCWEAYSSATALINMTNEKILMCRNYGKPTRLTECLNEEGRVDGRTAFEAMKLGDDEARDVVNEYVMYLANGIASIINIFQPEVLSIGGGISGEGDLLLELVEPLVRSQQYGPGLVPLTRLCIAELGNNAGIMGAANL